MPKDAPKTSSSRDIFRILTRGTNLKSSASKPSNLPSAGAQANPQLFHDEVRGQKRKRAGVSDEKKEEEEEELPDVDFFAPKKEVGKKVEKKPRREEGQKVVKPTERLSPEECRQVLKSHRIKITLMHKHEEKAKVKKSKKKEGHHDRRNSQERGEEAAVPSTS